ncbi:thiamine pyrophosphate-requiring protein [Actinoallomurus rhizosphaericola]|uniref:thiamine pyrophosphate-requiring protein n=1 Tax=Actinoallomurus rhizosphaericola TaxID=2952536 RepID=UPI002091CF40|nr:thiamine pyrophosphate-requiring protein [Actinoallomurus rhizosphaericola]MCO5993418.1 thiamine pyrophosphate-requiring protein [Actinoallomurus rhizosphaericola]
MTEDFRPRTTAEHLLWLLHQHGVDHLFLNPGTDSAPLQEAAVTLAEAGVGMPQIITCTFESVALAAAHGYWQVTGRPQAVFVHVDVGTQNLGAMVHNAMRDRAGVVVIAGKTPYGEDPDSPGGRSHTIHWQQDVPDQAGVVRAYAKWSLEVTRPDVLPRAIGRAVQVARSGRPGPAYLMVSRDVLMDPPATEPGRTDRYAVPGPPAADAGTVRRIADLLTTAERPLLITSRTGRRPGGFEAVTRLAERAGVRVIDTPESGCLNIATSHPMHVRSAGAARRAVGEADLIIVADCDVPWIPKFVRPAADATVVLIDMDPVKDDMPLWTFPVDLAVAAPGAVVLDQVAAALGDLDPAAKWRGAGAAEEPAASAGADDAIVAREVFEALNAVLRADDIVVEEAVTNAGTLHETLERSLPGTMAGTGSPGLGWGLGGAVGVKLAAPDQRVITVVGDGSFMFGVPTAALCLAAEAGAPILAVVLNNDGYKASRMPVFELFPEGRSAARGDAVGTRFQSPPDFAAVARACHAHGESVADRADLVPALQRALKALEAGRSAVVDVRLAPN